MTTAPKRRWFQLTLLDLLTIVFIVAVLVGLIVPSLEHNENTPPKTAPPVTSHS